LDTNSGNNAVSDSLANDNLLDNAVVNDRNPKHRTKNITTAAFVNTLRLALSQSQLQRSTGKQPPNDQAFGSDDTGIPLAWSSHQNPLLRDLAWLLSKPSVFVPKTLGYSAFQWPANLVSTGALRGAKTSEQLVTPSLDLITTTMTASGKAPSRSDTNRLGQYYEALIAYLQQHFYPQHRCFQNVQLIANKQTLGEADFIVETGLGKWCHLEVAIKFFLLRDDADADPKNLSHWLGPNSRDRLDKKLHHMDQQQLALLENPDNLALLNQTLRERGLDKAIETLDVKHLLQGALFTHLYSLTKKSNETIKDNAPINDADVTHHLPLPFNAGAHAGYWIRHNELCMLLSGTDSLKQDELRWVLLKKTEWLGGLHQNDWQSRALGSEELITTLANVSLPRLVLCLSPSSQFAVAGKKADESADNYSGENRHWNEFKLMITTDYWPDTRMPSRSM